MYIWLTDVYIKMSTPDPGKGNPTSSEDHCLAPFIIGITGNTDPIGYGDTPEGKDILTLQGKIRAVFQWAQASDGYLDPVKGVYVATQVPAGMEPWRALGLNDTPIIVLSSLAWCGYSCRGASPRLEWQETAFPHRAR